MAHVEEFAALARTAREDGRGLARTIDRTIDDLQEGRTMTTETMFEGLRPQPLRGRGTEAMGRRCRRHVHRPDQELVAGRRRGSDRLRPGARGPGPVAGRRCPGVRRPVQQLVDLHHGVTSLFWAPGADAYRGLGQMYVDDGRFTATIGQGSDDLMTYLRDAMVVYAEAQLT